MASRVSPGLPTIRPADDEHVVVVQVLDGGERRVAGAPAALLVLRVLGRRLEEAEVVLEHVLDPEEHVAEAGLTHQRRQRRAVVGDRRRRRLDRVLELVQPGVDDRLAQRREALARRA